MGLTPLNLGDWEALYKVPYAKVWEIANMFNMVKKRPSNQNIDGLREYRKRKAAS
jgi:hypothetical protein